MRIKRKKLFLIIEKYLREQELLDSKFDNLTYVSEEDIKKGITLFSEIGEMLFTLVKLFEEPIQIYIDKMKRIESAVEKMNKTLGSAASKIGFEAASTQDLLMTQNKKMEIFGVELGEIESLLGQYSAVMDINKVVESEIRKALESNDYDKQQKIREALLDANKIHKTYKSLLSKTQSYVNKANKISSEDDEGLLDALRLMFELFLDVLVVLEGITEIQTDKTGFKDGIIPVIYLFLSTLNDVLDPVRNYKETVKSLLPAIKYAAKMIA